MIRNESMEPLRFEVEHRRSAATSRTSSPSRSTTSRSATRRTRRRCRRAAPAAWTPDGRSVSFDERRRPHARCVLARRPHDAGALLEVELEPRERGSSSSRCCPHADAMAARRGAGRTFGDELAHVRDSLVAWQLRVPQVSASWDALGQAFRARSATSPSLRMRADGDLGKLPAAGMPWFMTVFGRDTIITCLQTLIFGPELARTALRALADLQSREDDPSTDAEPGKIVHEVRTGKAAQRLVRRATTARPTRRRSTSCCSPRSGAGRTTRSSCTS